MVEENCLLLTHYHIGLMSMNDMLFAEDLLTYRTAFSRGPNQPVIINEVRLNSLGEVLLDCEYQDVHGFSQNHFFHPDELTDYRT